MRGRKPNVQIATGEAVTADEKPPAWLAPVAKREWRKALLILAPRRTLTEGDLPTLANYCAALATVQQCQAILSTEGLCFMGTSGPKRHPATGIMNEAMTQARQLAAELGLTPVSRARPAIRDSDDDEAFMDI